MLLPPLQRPGGAPHRQSSLLGVCRLWIPDRAEAWDHHGELAHAADHVVYCDLVDALAAHDHDGRVGFQHWALPES